MQGTVSKVAFSLGLAILLVVVGGWFGPSRAAQSGGEVDRWLAELKTQVPSPQAGPSAAPATPVAGADAHGKAGGAGAEAAHHGGNSPSAASPLEENVPHISVDFYKIDLHNVFRLLGKVSGKNIVVDEGVHGTITLALNDVPWTFVLEVIKNLKGLASVERYNTILIFPAGKSVVWAPGSSKAGGEAQGTLEVKKAQEKPKPAKVEIKKQAGQPPLLPTGPTLTIEGTSKYKVTMDQEVAAQKHVNKALKAEKHKDYYTAYTHYRAAADLWPTNISLAKKVASLALGVEDDEITAYNYAKRVLELDPEDSEAATMAAVALARMDKEKEARVYFERAMASPNVGYKALYNYAVFHFSHGEYRDCLRLIARIEAKFPLNADVMLLKARCYEGLGEKEKAVAQYRSVLHGGKGIPAEAVMFAQERLAALGR